MKEVTEDQFRHLLEVIAGKNFEHAAVVISMLVAWVHSNRSLQGSLADFAWHCLEHDPPVKFPADAWKFGQLAARLAQDSPERGFRLLERLVQRNERDNRHWDPLNQHEGHQFWDVLNAKDKERLIGLLLNAAREDALKQFHISWRLRRLLNQEEDKVLLFSFARDNIENARIIADWSTSAKAGFWPIVFKLVARYPHDEGLLSNLTAGFMQQGTASLGPISQFYETHKREAEQILREPFTPPEVRAWLREVVDRLERRIPHEIVWEYDIDIDGLRRHIEDKNSAQRM